MTRQGFAVGITILFAVMLLPQLRAVLNFFPALFTSIPGYSMALVCYVLPG
jgi:hypothetical protein